MKTDLAGQIARREIVPPVVTTATVLSAFWRERMSALFPGETVLIDTKAMGQFSQIIAKIGEDKSLSAVAFALSNWAAFRYAVNLQLEGTAICPKVPQIGVILRHRAILISMMDACN
ncbi:hypothetical protein [Caballeronia sp. LjRoot31]|uniref:hypothetical protein n=1 Tax=Caballeronia sp. LjRoot31 TaxID=3342324 RepID=UPI003ECF84EB